MSFSETMRLARFVEAEQVQHCQLDSNALKAHHMQKIALQLACVDLAELLAQAGITDNSNIQRGMLVVISRHKLSHHTISFSTNLANLLRTYRHGIEQHIYEHDGAAVLHTAATASGCTQQHTIQAE
jgi:hypothetical protein